MTRQEMVEINIAASNINETDRSAIVIRIKEDGEVRMSAYGKPESLVYAYEIVSKAWKNYDEKQNNVFGIFTLYKPNQ